MVSPVLGALEGRHRWQGSLLSCCFALSFGKTVSTDATRAVFLRTVRRSWCHRALELMIDSIDHHRRDCWLLVPIFSRREIKFDWRFMTEFMLLELNFSIMMLSRFVCSSSKLSLILLINKERVRNLFLCSTDVCKRSSWFFMLSSVILNLFNAYCNFWLFSFVILLSRQ